MMKTQAMLFTGAANQLELQEIEIPDPKPGETIVKVDACSLCGTDVHFIQGHVPIVALKKGTVKYMVCGHEIIGTDVQTGKMVIVPAVLACYQCDMCLSGRSNMCRNALMLGNAINGGFAQHIHIPRANNLLVLPDNIADLINFPVYYLCVMADAMTTAYHAVFNRAGVKPGDKVAVIGGGGVGLNVAQFATAACAEVVVLDIDKQRAERAMGFGAKAGICLRRDGDPAQIFKEVRKEVKDALKGDPDFCFEVVGHPSAFSLALGLLGIGSQLINVGYTADQGNVPLGNIMAKEQRVIGSYGCPPPDYRRVLSMVLNGNVKLEELVTGEFPLSDLGKAIEVQGDPETIRSVIVP